MKIANGVEMLEIPATVMGTPSKIYPSLEWDKETVVLMGPEPKYTYDLDLSIESLGKLKKYDIENIISYHRGLYKISKMFIQMMNWI